MEQWSRKADETKAEVFKEDKVLKDLTDKFNQLQMENKKAKDELNCKLEFDITSEELQIALRVFEEMNQKSKDDLKESEKQLEEELERIKRGNDTSGEESVVNKVTSVSKNKGYQTGIFIVNKKIQNYCSDYKPTAYHCSEKFKHNSQL